MAWKYIADEVLDIINRGIPYSLYKGKIVKEVHIPYIQERYPERLMECDEYGELLVTKKIKEKKEQIIAATQPIPEIKVESIKQIEEKPPSLPKVVEKLEVKLLEKPVEKVSVKPQIKHIEHVEKHTKVEKPKPEKKLDRVDKTILNLKSAAQLKPMFKENLEEVCKKLGLSTEGSKGALIKKISAALDLK